MKYLIYKAKGYTSVYNPDTEESERKEILVGVKTLYTEEAQQMALSEAYSGEYTIEDDGQPEPEAHPSEAERIADLEEAMAMILSGVTE